MKWIPITEKEQWPKEDYEPILVMRQDGQWSRILADRLKTLYSAGEVTHFATIPSLDDSEAREKKKEELRTAIKEYAKFYDTTYATEFYEIEELLNQL